MRTINAITLMPSPADFLRKSCSTPCTKSPGSVPNIPGVPAGTRATQLPDVGITLPSGFLETLGRPVRESVCECERSNDIQLGPVMAMLSGPVVAEAIANPSNAITTW